MPALTPINWPSARHFTEALQFPAVCFTNPYLRDTQPAVDKLGMPLVTSGQFAYVYKLNRSDGGAWAVRCFRSYLSDRQERYAAFDTHFREHFLTALPRFAYEPEGLLIGGRRYPILVMEWLTAPTLDSYVGKVLDKPEVLQHLADEWVRLMADLEEAGVAHGDLQHGNILVQHGGFRLVDLDGMYVPALRGWRACEVGHQHYQHPKRAESWFHKGLDNFSALSIYLSLTALAARPSLWSEHHDENLLFTKTDFQKPDKSALFGRLRELGGEHQTLTALLADACRTNKPEVPPLTELVKAKERTNLPAWMNAPEGSEVVTRTREARRAPTPAPQPVRRPWYSGATPQPGEFLPQPAGALQTTPQPNIVQPAGSSAFQTLFNSPAPVLRDPADLWGNTFYYAGQGVKNVFSKIGAFWVIFLFSSIWIRLITGFWSLFGVDAAGAFALTFLLTTFGFLVYGFLCAVELSNAPALAGGAGQPATLPAPVAQQQAALPPAMPSNIPWYRQTAAPPPVPSRPLPPGVRRAPDWVLAAQQPAEQPPPAPPQSLSQVVVLKGIYHLPNCDEVATRPPADVPAFASPLSAQQAGHRPCPVCNPYAWPLAPQQAPPPPKPPPAAAPKPVVANRDTGVYHRPDCEDAVIIAAEDELKFASHEAAERAGLRPCPTCKPATKTAPARRPVVANRETRIYHLPDCQWADKAQSPKVQTFASPFAAEGKGFFPCTSCRPDAAKS